MTNEEIITKLGELVEESKSLIDKIDVSEIGTLHGGTGFHGEVWAICPYCNESMELMGSRCLLKKDGYRLLRCEKCKRIVKYS